MQQCHTGYGRHTRTQLKAQVACSTCGHSTKAASTDADSGDTGSDDMVGRFTFFLLQTRGMVVLGSAGLADSHHTHVHRSPFRDVGARVHWTRTLRDTEPGYTYSIREYAIGPSHGKLIGQASNPGPTSFDDPEFFEDIQESTDPF